MLAHPEPEEGGRRWPGSMVHPAEAVDGGTDGFFFRGSARTIELLKELNVAKVTEEQLLLMPNLLSALKNQDPVVVKQSIAYGTSFYRAVLEEVALQLRISSKAERWLEEMWSWMVKFKDAMVGIIEEPCSLGVKVLALKFVENWVLYFFPLDNENEVLFSEGKRSFSVSQLAQDNSIFNPAALQHELDRNLGCLLNILQMPRTIGGSVVLAAINSLAAIVKNRPLCSQVILPALLSFESKPELLKGTHAGSIRYSLKTAFLGFLRSNHPSINESREKLIRTLRGMIPGETLDQVIRQAERLTRNNDCMPRDIRAIKDDQSSSQVYTSGDLSRKRSSVHLVDVAPWDVLAKRTHFTSPVVSDPQMECDLRDADGNDGVDDSIKDGASNPSLIGDNSSPAEKITSMIGALLAEGERGAGSLDLLISSIPADLLADIVIETMKHLPINPMPLSGLYVKAAVNPPSNASQNMSSLPVTVASLQSISLHSESAATALGASGLSNINHDVEVANLLSDVKRDPRRDPRRLDPRRAVAHVGSHSVSLNMDSSTDVQPEQGHMPSKPIASSESIKLENASSAIPCKTEIKTTANLLDEIVDMVSVKEIKEVLDNSIIIEPSSDVQGPTSSEISAVCAVEKELAASTSSDNTAMEGVDANVLESDEHSSPASSTLMTEDNYDLSILPPHVQLTDEQKRKQQKLAVVRTIENDKHNEATECCQTRFPLLARMVAEMGGDDDIVKLLQQHIISVYHHQQGHELAMHALYVLQSTVTAQSNEYSSSFAASSYEKFLLVVAKALLSSLPASDKSFSRLLTEAPFLPDSILKLLEDLCHSHGNENYAKDNRDNDCVTQGLSALWSMILTRPPYRQACLDIALKCTLHVQDEIRAKAIRLVANKLYPLDYASEIIEQYATKMLLSVVDEQNFELEIRSTQTFEQTTSQEASNSDSQNSEPAFQSESLKGSQTLAGKVSTISISDVQQRTSLFFALCTKKPNLLLRVFETYGRAPKAVKQYIHRHLPNVLRNLGASDSELLHILSNPPEGSENLIMLVVQTLSEESTPSNELIAAVKHLYETKLKDAAILIPLLSSLSKDEVLPIFPRLVDLPIEKFQAALARILQGSAHTGPALTPAEVLIAIHNINPEKDAIDRRKIIDACTACFEQKTVFTEQVLARSLSHLVEQVPIPFLFMRTVIQAIGAYPSLVDFVMEILLKLVAKQVWKMPNLWVGFLKCASQTIPCSFHVLLQLPPPQLENALNRHPNLRSPLAAHANQLQMSSIPRPILGVLGLVTDQAP